MRGISSGPVSLLLLVTLGCGGPSTGPDPQPDPARTVAPPSGAPVREPILIVPVPDKAQEGDARYEADWSFDLRDGAHASVHVHVIPPGQMVPLHRHPGNWELTFVAAGLAEWTAVAGGDAPREESTTLRAGEAAVAPPGAAHQVRNRGEELLAAVVVHQPRFGQNWYLPADEVTNPVLARPLGDEAPALPHGWSLGWLEGAEGLTQGGDRYLLFATDGALRFEGKEVPVRTGAVAAFPPGVELGLSGRALSIEVPRP